MDRVFNGADYAVRALVRIRGEYSTDGGVTWKILEKMGIAQMLPNGAMNTYHFLVGQGYGKPETRRLPSSDYGLLSTRMRSPPLHLAHAGVAGGERPGVRSQGGRFTRSRLISLS